MKDNAIILEELKRYEASYIQLVRRDILASPKAAGLGGGLKEKADSLVKAMDKLRSKLKMPKLNHQRLIEIAYGHGGDQ